MFLLFPVRRYHWCYTVMNNCFGPAERQLLWMAGKGFDTPSLLAQCLVGSGHKSEKWQEMLCPVLVQTSLWLLVPCHWHSEVQWTVGHGSAGYQVSQTLKWWPFSLSGSITCLYEVLCLFWVLKWSADKLTYLSCCPQWDLCLVFQQSLQ